jgi:hypothetical protein
VFRALGSVHSLRLEMTYDTFLPLTRARLSPLGLPPLLDCRQHIRYMAARSPVLFRQLNLRSFMLFVVVLSHTWLPVSLFHCLRNSRLRIHCGCLGLYCLSCSQMSTIGWVPCLEQLPRHVSFPQLRISSHILSPSAHRQFLWFPSSIAHFPRPYSSHDGHHIRSP